MRARALWFFSAVAPFAATTAALPLLRGDRSKFRNVFADGDQETDLERTMILIVAKLVVSGDREAIIAAPAEALNPAGRPLMLSGASARVDSDWVRQHRAEIERLHPETKKPIENNLE